MWVDNVSIIVCTVAPPITPTHTSTPTPTLHLSRPGRPRRRQRGCRRCPPAVRPTRSRMAASKVTAPGSSGTAPCGGHLWGQFSTRRCALCGWASIRRPAQRARIRCPTRRSASPLPFHPSPAQHSCVGGTTIAAEEAPAPNPPNTADRQEVILLRSELGTEVILQRVRQNDPGWVQAVVDLTPFRGQSLVLYFNVYNDGNGLRTWQYLDDVEIGVCYPEVTATPAMPTSTPAPPMPLPTMIPTLLPIITSLAPELLTPGSMAVMPLPAAAAAVAAGAGEPKVFAVDGTPTPPSGAGAQKAAAAALATATPRTGSGSRPLSSVMTWLGVMLGALAVIGLLVGVALQYTSRNRQP